jgi:putative phosphoribosyl transferase
MGKLVLGAVGPDGVVVCDHELAHRFSPTEISSEIARQRAAVSRLEDALRAGRVPPDVHGKVVVLVDDGMITGSSMRAAVAWARGHGAARVVVAVPVSPPHTVKRLADEADEVVCLAAPLDFTSIAGFYDEFPHPDTGEVAAELARARLPRGAVADIDPGSRSAPR